MRGNYQYKLKDESDGDIKRSYVTYMYFKYSKSKNLPRYIFKDWKRYIEDYDTHSISKIRVGSNDDYYKYIFHKKLKHFSCLNIYYKQKDAMLRERDIYETMKNINNNDFNYYQSYNCLYYNAPDIDCGYIQQDVKIITKNKQIKSLYYATSDEEQNTVELDNLFLNNNRDEIIKNLKKSIEDVNNNKILVYKSEEKEDEKECEVKNNNRKKKTF